MRASDAVVSHLTDECVDAATACSSRVSQLYDNASVALQAGPPRHGLPFSVDLALQGYVVSVFMLLSFCGGHIKCFLPLHLLPVSK